MESLSSLLLPRAQQRKFCTVDTCPLSFSVYGYLPNKGANIFFLVLFALSFAAHTFQGVRSKSWTFLIAFAVGAFGEAVGYVGRLLLRKDPFSRQYLTIMLVPITVAPAFLAGGIYLTLKHLIIVYGAKFSRIAPRWYTWIFVACDIFSICVQSLGAGIASTGTHPETGNNIMMVGLSSQVATLVIFGVMAIDVFLRIRKHSGSFNASTATLRHSKKYKGLLAAIITAYVTITLRCIYRIAEMAGGWRNKIMQDEPTFIVLDSCMCLIACVVLNFFHPGFLFHESQAVMKAEPAAAANDTEMVATDTERTSK
ncbi:RTA1 like protein-domain-containing protein [Halenospora varia]|nr:RTA1 like protein-domain-containing protein [Halenospora varia]